MDFPESTRRILRNMVRNELGNTKRPIKKTQNITVKQGYLEPAGRFDRAPQHDQKKLRGYMATMSMAMSFAVVALISSFQNRPIDLSFDPLQQSAAVR